MKQPSSEIDALKRRLTQLPRFTEADQTKLLVDLLALEDDWKSELIATHGLAPFERLADEHLKNFVTTLFRLRQKGQKAFFADVRAGRWEEVSKVGINYAFIAWSRPHAAPTQAMTDLERRIVVVRHQLVESVLALVLRQSIAFAKGSKIRTATIADLVAISAEGVLDGVDKYVPDGEVSARAWKSTALGRANGYRLAFSEAQTTAHLAPKDSRRLYRLRTGKVAASDVTADDRELLSIGNVVVVGGTSSAYDSDGNIDGLDVRDPNPNPEEALLAKEEAPKRARREAEEDAAIDRELARRARRRVGRPVRDLTTGIVYPSGVIAARAVGLVQSQVSTSARKGLAIRGHRFEFVD